MTNVAQSLNNYLKKYSDAGLKIFPFRARTKMPACAHGYKDATSDFAKIQKLWGEYQHNVGLATGRINNIVVVDVDDIPKWEVFLSKFDEELPKGPTVKTGKGFHLYFKYPENWVVGCRQIRECGFDVKSDGGGVVAPPSVHENGTVYDYIQGGDLPELPKWLLEVIGKPVQIEADAPRGLFADNISGNTPYGARALEDESRALSQAPEGTRNGSLNAAAFNIGGLVTGGQINSHEALKALSEAAKHAGLGAFEIEKTLASGFRAGQMNPRGPNPAVGLADDLEVMINESISPLDQLRSYSVNGSYAEMKQQMLEDIYVLKDVAIMGQWTTFYAAPNTGKTLITLWMLIEQVKNKELHPKNVFYVNADDNFKGACEKLELLEGLDIQMLLPYHNEFNTPKLLPLVEALVAKEEAKCIVIVLDTLKKFTDLMDKKKATDFGKLIRAFVSKGGTAITLAHTNKNRGDDGKPVFGGTSDILDDCDCSYILDAGEPDKFGKHWVIFENIKSRGDVADQVMFTFSKSKGNTYQDVINSIERRDAEEKELTAHLSKKKHREDKDQEVIEAILDYLADDELQTKDLINGVHELTVFSKSRIKTVLLDYAGGDYLQGNRWSKRKGEQRNQRLYKKLPDPLEANIANMLNAASVGEGGEF